MDHCSVHKCAVVVFLSAKNKHCVVLLEMQWIYPAKKDNKLYFSLHY